MARVVNDPLLERFANVRNALRAATLAAGRKETDVRLVAVGKVHPYEKIRALYQAGQRDFGENYVQELVEKAERATAEGLAEIRWHFIGHLQTNKVKSLLPYVAMIHGVSSLRLGEEIAKKAEKKRIPILIEVNIDDEESKSGVRISELRTLVSSLATLPALDLRGLMGIPNPTNATGPRDAFHRLAALAADHGLSELSMGMTNDYADAIAEGATLVRIGTAIFGERSPREKL